VTAAVRLLQTLQPQRLNQQGLLIQQLKTATRNFASQLHLFVLFAAAPALASKLPAPGLVLAALPAAALPAAAAAAASGIQQQPEHAALQF
jgi:hypothetical protein